jgi:hypothetical protein
MVGSAHPTKNTLLQLVQDVSYAFFNQAPSGLVNTPTYLVKEVSNGR